MPPAGPDRIGPYSVVRVIDRGGMGVVYQARDPRLDRWVALKSLPSELTMDADAIERLRRESLALAALDHPNIATIFGVEDHGGARYLVLEFVEGESLDDRLKRGPIDLAEALAINIQVAGALEAAHEGGILHRDLKPANIRITPQGRVKLLDFGLAKRLVMQTRGTHEPPGRGNDSWEAPLTGLRTVVGTPGYMSPEQVGGQELDERCDVWALGCLLYECLTGKMAFEGDSFSRTAASVIRDEVDLDALPSGTQQSLRELLESCLQKDPALRPCSCRMVRLHLEKTLADPAWSGVGWRAPSGPPHNLPVTLTSFIGRERELVDISRFLGKTRLATLTGVGGCGKSRLALEVARTSRDDFPDGVWLVELASLRDPRLVPQAVGSVFGVKGSGRRGTDRGLIDYLGQRTILLVLDNCEHLLEACGSLAHTLLRSCPALRILATSREPLGTEGERSYHVPPLSLPGEEPLSPLESLLECEAIRLFDDRARAARPGFRLEERNGPVIADICRRLDGIPLAIELAAARVRVLSVKQISHRLRDSLSLLTGGHRSGIQHHATLEGTIEWSHRLLSGQEKVMFRRLGVFSGGWSLDAAEEVTAGEEIRREEVLDLLTALVDKSLVEVQRGGPEGRYRYLDTIARFARNRLNRSDEESLLCGRHLTYYRHLAQTAGEELAGPRQSSWLTSLACDLANFRAALRWSLFEDGEAENGLRLALSLSRFLGYQGHWSEARDLLSRLLERAGPTASRDLRSRAMNSMAQFAESHSDYGEAERLCGEALAIAREDQDWPVIAHCLHTLAIVASRRGRYAEAKGLLEEGLDIFRDVGHRRGIAVCLNELSRVTWNLGDYTTMRTLLEESLAIRRELGDVHGIAQCLNNLGLVAVNLGEYESARTLYEEGLELWRKIGDKRGIAAGLTNLGSLAKIRNRFAEARASYQESLALKKELGDREGVGTCLQGLGSVSLQEKQLDLAREMYQEAHAIFRSLGHRKGTGQCLYSLGNVALEGGDLLEARALYEKGLAICRRIGDRLDEASAMRGLGDVAFEEEKMEEARACYEDSLAISRDIGDRWGIAHTLSSIGNLALELGRVREAEARYEESLPILRGLGDQKCVADCLEGLGGIALDKGDRSRARTLYRESLNLRRSRGDDPGISVTLGHLASIALEAGRPARGALLLGAAKAHGSYSGAKRRVASARMLLANDMAAQAALGFERYLAVEEEGKSMSLDQAVNLAFHDL